MGFKEESIAFKRSLPEIATLPLTEASRRQCVDMMQEALALKKMLDPSVKDSPAARFQEVKSLLAGLQYLTKSQGFRHGRIAFCAVSRVAPKSGSEYEVKSIEELPE